MFTVLCFGDSNTYGWNPEDWGRYPRGVRWPTVLQDLLGLEYHVIEEGCGGRTAVMDDGLETFVSGAKYLDPCLRSHCPLDLVVIMLGTNDLKRRYQLSPQDIANGVGKLCGMAQEVLRFEQKKQPQILIISPIHLGAKIAQHEVNYEMFDYDHGIESSKKLASFYRQVAEKYGCHFMDAASVAEPSEADSVHLNAAGHRAIAQAVADRTREIMEGKA